ncbi:MAG: sugar fermentation stimulation protein A [Alphaproteobacteria bacterium]|jgi:sugar fermentation stimulation protein A
MAQHIFKTPLIKAQFVKRYKRFFVDATLDDGTVITSHTNNTGSMKGLLENSPSAYFTPNNDPKRKLKFAFEMVDNGTSLVGVNTSVPNSLVFDSIVAGDVPELTGYAHAKREVKYGKEGKSRIDVYLSDDNKPDCYVEVKNTTLKVGDQAQFPDAVTSRGTKHLEELILEVEKGNRAVMFYLAQRSDCTSFSTADNIDPLYAETLKKALKAGVEVLCYSCQLTLEKITLAKPLPLKL